jgi:MinD superfamily P-loop ATPase
MSPMPISIASGKGGTGKTTVATNLARSIVSNVQLLDCDVEEPNAHLFINFSFEETETFFMPVPEVDEEKCTYCKKCGEICQFKAIAVVNKNVLIFEELCHSCGGCWEVCPQGAITQSGRELGIIQKGHSNGIEFIHGRLRIGEAMSPPLIKKVRSYQNPEKLTIIDAPPGTSCPVIASMKDADVVLLVTEPTLSGIHDLQRVVQLANHFNVPAMVCVNKFDLNLDLTRDIENFARDESLSCLGRIPFDPIFTEAMVQGQTIFEYNRGSSAGQAVTKIWNTLSNILNL